MITIFLGSPAYKWAFARSFSWVMLPSDVNGTPDSGSMTTTGDFMNPNLNSADMHKLMQGQMWSPTNQMGIPSVPDGFTPVYSYTYPDEKDPNYNLSPVISTVTIFRNNLNQIYTTIDTRSKQMQTQSGLGLNGVTNSPQQIYQALQLTPIQQNQYNNPMANNPMSYTGTPNYSNNQNALYANNNQYNTNPSMNNANWRGTTPGQYAPYNQYNNQLGMNQMPNSGSNNMYGYGSYQQASPAVAYAGSTGQYHNNIMPNIQSVAYTSV